MEALLSEELKEKLKKNNQEHLLDFIKYIKTKEEIEKYVSGLEKNDYELLSHLYTLYKAEKKEEKFDENKISAIQSQYNLKSLDNVEELKQKGYMQIAQGKVALLILAGGLGTRLGWDKPKGMYTFNTPSNKSLFEYLCNRFLSSQIEAKKNYQHNHKESTLFIMTSQKNNDEIVDFFKKNNYFHIKKENVIFFSQNEICALDTNGKIISLSPSEIYHAADGNGGCFTAIKKHNILQICQERGIDFLNVIAIDNPLYKVIDPVFVGLTIEKGKSGKDQMAAKFIKKRSPDEKVGNFLVYNDHPMMLDYMEIPDSLKNLRNNDGDLVYNASNILDYLISVSFLKKILADEVKFKELINQFHLLKKKFNGCYIENGSVITKQVDGIKFEIFFNSIFEFAEREGLLLFEIERDDEFAPVKNKDGEITNTPTVTRIKMSNLFKKWYRAAGGEIINDDESNLLEISFLLSFDGKDLLKNNPNIPTKIEFHGKNDKKYLKNEKYE